MAKVTVNFADVPSQIVAPGEHEVILNKVTYKESNKPSNNGATNDYLNWEFELVEGDWAGQRVWAMTPLSPEGLWRTKQFFDECGLDSDAIGELEIDDDTGEIVFPPFSGKPMRVKIETNDYKGRKQSRPSHIVEFHGDWGGDELLDEDEEELELDPDDGEPPWDDTEDDSDETEQDDAEPDDEE